MNILLRGIDKGTYQSCQHVKAASNQQPQKNYKRFSLSFESCDFGRKDYNPRSRTRRQKPEDSAFTSLWQTILPPKLPYLAYVTPVVQKEKYIQSKDSTNMDLPLTRFDKGSHNLNSKDGRVAIFKQPYKNSQKKGFR